ncbi:MAG: MFS transporter [Dehalococcoidia bacterium]|nr:MFS transporter [Dehalococcoidia bacterium]
MWDRVFLSFNNRSYRWLWLSGFLRAFSMAMGVLTQSWLILELTDTGSGGSPFWVGAGAGVMGATTLMIAPVGGWLADRFDRRLILVLLDFLTLLTSVALFMLIAFDLVEMWHVGVLAISRGIAMAWGMPARNALTFDLVGRDVLLNATAANFTTQGLSRIIGPALMGIIIGRAGIEWCYLFMAITSLLSILCLLNISASNQDKIVQNRILSDIKEALNIAMKPGLVRSLLLMSPIIEIFGFSYQVMLPVMAREVLQVGPEGLGILGSSAGLGSLAGAVLVASFGNYRKKGMLLIVSTGGFGLFLALFAVSEILYISAVFICLAGAMATIYDVNMSTLLQSLSPDRTRGRIMGLLVLTYGISPLGGFQAGIIASMVSAPFAIFIGGSMLVLNSFRCRSLMKRIIEYETDSK